MRTIAITIIVSIILISGFETCDTISQATYDCPEGMHYEAYSNGGLNIGGRCVSDENPVDPPDPPPSSSEPKSDYRIVSMQFEYKIYASPPYGKITQSSNTTCTLVSLANLINSKMSTCQVTEEMIVWIFDMYRKNKGCNINVPTNYWDYDVNTFVPSCIAGQTEDGKDIKISTNFFSISLFITSDELQSALNSLQGCSWKQAIGAAYIPIPIYPNYGSSNADVNGWRNTDALRLVTQSILGYHDLKSVSSGIEEPKYRSSPALIGAFFNLTNKVNNDGKPINGDGGFNLNASYDSRRFTDQATFVFDSDHAVLITDVHLSYSSNYVSTSNINYESDCNANDEECNKIWAISMDDPYWTGEHLYLDFQQLDEFIRVKQILIPSEAVLFYLKQDYDIFDIQELKNKVMEWSADGFDAQSFEYIDIYAGM